MDVTVTNAQEKERYEAWVGGELAAVADYIPTDELVAFVHTKVSDGFEGKGVAGALIQGALDDVRSQHRKVLAVCPFVRAYIERHVGDYGDLRYESQGDTIRD